MRIFWKIGLGAATILLPLQTSAAQQVDPHQTIRVLHDQDVAVTEVGYRLATGAVGLCGGRGRAMGWALQLLSLYSSEYRGAAASDLGISDLPTVAVVAPDSPAARAGLQPGDRLIALNAEHFAAQPASAKGGVFEPTGAVLDRIDHALGAGPAALTVQRGGAEIQASLPPQQACVARYDVRAGYALNAYSDGVTVQVSSELMNFAEGRGEIAAIIAHELSHNILHHPQRLKRHERGLSVRDTEVQADRLSIYVMVLAGYDPHAAVSFWTRFGKAHDPGFLSDGSHPSWKKRVASFEQEIARIEGLRAAGHPIAPPAELTPPA